MTKESRIEVIIFSALAAFAVALWWMNRANGAGTGLDQTPFDISLPGLASGGYTPGAAAGGLTLNLPAIGAPSFGGTLGTSPSGGGNCGCPSCEQGSAVAFGTQGQLADWLATQLQIGQLQAATQPGGYN